MLVSAIRIIGLFAAGASAYITVRVLWPDFRAWWSDIRWIWHGVRREWPLQKGRSLRWRLWLICHDISGWWSLARWWRWLERRQ